MLIAAERSPQSVSNTTTFNEDSHKPSKSKPKPRPKDNSKPTPQSERSLKQLEALHERMGVEKSLQLGGGSRIKLKHDLTSEAKPARRPVPKFDVEFSQVADDLSTAREPLDVELSDTDSDCELPGIDSILDALKRPVLEKKPASSESTDYDNSEFDALIADLPLADGVQQTGATGGRAGTTKAPGTGNPDTMHWTPATPSKKRKKASSPQPFPQAKKGKYTRSSSPPIEVRDMSAT